MQEVRDTMTILEEDHFETEKQYEHSDALPWNIIREPPPVDGRVKKDFYPMEGTWRMVSNENLDTFLKVGWYGMQLFWEVLCRGKLEEEKSVTSKL